MTELSQMPPPRRGARAGFYPDPLGGKFAREWDGVKWTPNLGPETGEEAPLNRALEPPAKVCPRCAAESNTFESSCPNCGRSYKRPTALKLIGISVAVVLLSVGGLGACFALGASDLASSTITEEEFDAVAIGTSRDEVERELGDPYDTFEIEGGECITYTKEGDLFGDWFDLCFDRAERLVFKDVY